MDVEQGWNNAWNSVAEFLPRLLGFLVILALTWLVAKALATLTTKLLRKAGVDDKVQQNEYGRRSVGRMDGGLSGLLGTVVKVAVWLVGLSLAFGVFGPNPISDYLAAIVAFIPKLLVAVVIVAVAFWLASVVRNVLRGVLGGVSYGNTVANVAGGFIALFGVLAALTQLEVAPAIVTAIAYATLAAIAGVVIVGVGGGLIGPMRERWERTLNRVEQDGPQVKQQARSRKEEMEQRKAQRQQDERYQPYPNEPARADHEQHAMSGGGQSEVGALRDSSATGYGGGAGAAGTGATGSSGGGFDETRPYRAAGDDETRGFGATGTGDPHHGAGPVMPNYGGVEPATGRSADYAADEDATAYGYDEPGGRGTGGRGTGGRGRLGPDDDSTPMR